MKSVNKKPAFILLIVIISIYIIELFNMYLLYLLPDIPKINEAILESTLLIVLIFPVLYLFLLHPMLSYISKSKRELDIRNALFYISEAANSSKSIEKLISRIHHILGELIDTKNFYVALYDEKKDHYTFPYFVDEYDEPNVAPKILKQSLTEYVRRRSRPLPIDSEGIKKLEKKGEIILAGTLPPIWLGASLITSTGVIGVVTAQRATIIKMLTRTKIRRCTFD